MTRPQMKLRIQMLCIEMNKSPPIFLPDSELKGTLKHLEKELELHKVLKVYDKRVRANGYKEED